MPEYPPNPEQLSSGYYTEQFGLKPEAEFDKFVGFIAVSNGDLRGQQVKGPGNGDTVYMFFNEDEARSRLHELYAVTDSARSNKLPGEIDSKTAGALSGKLLKKLIRTVRHTDDDALDSALCWALDYYHDSE